MTHVPETSAFLRGMEHRPLPRSAHPHIDVALVDRDGTLNRLLPGYRTLADFELLDGAADAVAELNCRGIPVVLITNQQGLSTGKLTWKDLEAVHAQLVAELHASSAHLDDIRVCPHRENTCQCRKPLPGLLTEVLRENPWAQESRSIMFGDSDADAGAAAAAGVSFVRVGAGMTFKQRVLDTFR